MALLVSTSTNKVETTESPRRQTIVAPWASSLLSLFRHKFMHEELRYNLPVSGFYTD